tara:strand:+ start:588 stop:836 length:249 start_codon:yes stop_codon:yes gene_type:complete
MKKIRKVDTKKRKQQAKEAEEKLSQVTSLMQSHPEECCLCHTPFERTSETVKTWQVMIKEEIVRLTCPNCWGTIKEVVENEE